MYGWMDGSVKNSTRYAPINLHDPTPTDGLAVVLGVPERPESAAVRRVLRFDFAQATEWGGVIQLREKSMQCIW